MKKVLIVCNFSLQGDWQMANAADANGLVSGHAYTVTAVAKVRLGHFCNFSDMIWKFTIYIK